ncbi:fam-l protein [Plasmodium malariae]|uniref:Fam-l protein n=1 Tax=Plasmodium malariae TaxID=5858 RepID=A0A1D3PB77_PLAMA|nr:fam-l protein [Plasmodium malariae]SCN12511.1 fam-l protein [Plasmodium malariae]
MMEKYIMFPLFINFSAFIVLIWICNFSNDTHNKSIGENPNIYGKLDLRTYRLLANCNKHKDSSVTGLKECISYNAGNENKNMYSDEKWINTKNEYSNASSTKNKIYHKQTMKNKSNIFETKKYSYLEKKIFKEIDYFNFLKMNRTINNKVYEKAVLKKCRLRIFIPVILLMLLSIFLLLDIFCGNGLLGGMYWLLHQFSPGWSKTLNNILKESPLKSLLEYTYEMLKDNGKKVSVTSYSGPFLMNLLYFVPLILLCIICILTIVYYHKKVKKYEKIKFRKR